MKIAIGTNSIYKINSIKSAIYGLDIDCEFVYSKVDSEVSDQPSKMSETKLGSINRARNILKIYPDSDIALGVEFGYEPIDESYHMVCWASIVTADNRIFSEQSSTLELPKKLKVNLDSGIDIDSRLESLLEDLEDTHSNRIFINFIKKRKIIIESTENVMLRYLLDKTLYQ